MIRNRAGGGADTWGMKAIHAEPDQIPPPERFLDHQNQLDAPNTVKPALAWGPVPKPRQPPPTTDEVRSLRCPEADLPEPVEQALIDAIMRPLRDGETRQDGNARRERDILAIVATLSPAQAFRLGARIDNAYSTDPIVVALKRLISDRRKRLRDAIDDHRRIAHAAWAAGR